MTQKTLKDLSVNQHIFKKLRCLPSLFLHKFLYPETTFPMVNNINTDKCLDYNQEVWIMVTRNELTMQNGYKISIENAVKILREESPELFEKLIQEYLHN